VKGRSKMAKASKGGKCGARFPSPADRGKHLKLLHRVQGRARVENGYGAFSA